MKIEKTNLPEDSILKLENDLKFIDSYKGEFVDFNNAVNILTIGKLFFSTGPKWIDKLFMFRNKTVKLFGLKAANNFSKRQLQIENFKGEIGDQVGLFKVFHKTTHEIVLGEDDKHLDFRVSLYLGSNGTASSQKQLTISTLVKFHNQFGKIYFIPVRPFHKLIVPAMLKEIIRAVNKNESNTSPT